MGTSKRHKKAPEPIPIYSTAPIYCIDLDDEPSQRWNGVAHDHKEELLSLYNEVYPLLVGLAYGHAWIISFLLHLIYILSKIRMLPNCRELSGISYVTGIPVGGLFLIQYIYEASAACTSVIIPDWKSGQPVHLR